MTGRAIALVAPSGPFEPADMAEGIALARACGRPVTWYADPAEADGFLAASDARRAEHLHAAFADPAVGLVWALRGGYGALRLLPHLDLDRLRAHAKPLLGLSDVTLLLNVLAARAGVPTLHGPVVRQVSRLDAASLAALTTYLTTDELPRTHALRWLHGASVKGDLWGGNLATLCSAIATPWFPDLRGGLLFVEDINEAPYRVDRMFQSLAQAGALEGVSGLVLGRFSEPDPANGADRPADLRLDLLIDVAEQQGFSLATGLPCGHGATNTLLPVGGPASLDATAGVLEVRS
jgi:muramoyltetrapeptide carboxypeptidase